MQKCFRISAIIKLLALLVLLGSGQPVSGATLAELKAQLATAERNFATVYSSKDAMVSFTNNYPAKLAGLQSAYNDLQAMETTLQTLLVQNLVKSTILLAYETFDKIQWAAGLASSTLTDLVSDGVTHAVKNYAWDKAKEGMTDAVKDKIGIGKQDQADALSPYTVRIRSLKASTLVVMPDIKNIQTILRMSLEAVKARAWADERVDLNETGCLYRKYQMLLTAIPKAQTGIYQMRLQLTAAQVEFTGQLAAVEAERIRLGAICTSLRNQIEALHASQKASDEAAALTNYVAAGSVAPTVNDVIVNPSSTNEDPHVFVLRRKHEMEAYIAQEFPAYKSQADSLIAEIDQRGSNFTAQYSLYFEGSGLTTPVYRALALGNGRETLDIATIGTVLGIVQNHKNVKDAYDTLKDAAGLDVSLLIQAEIDWLAILDAFEALRSVEVNIDKLCAIEYSSRGVSLDTYWYVPDEPANLPAGLFNYTGISAAKGAAGACEFLGTIRDQQLLAASAMTTLDDLRKNYEAAMDATPSTNGVQSIFAMESAELERIEDTLTACESAQTQLVACAMEYSQLIRQNLFLSNWQTNAGAAGEYYFNLFSLEISIGAALRETEGHTGADPVWAAYAEVVTRYREINRRYSEAYVLYTQHFSQLKEDFDCPNYWPGMAGVSAPKVAIDLSQAASAGSYFVTPAPDLQLLTNRFSTVGWIWWDYGEHGSMWRNLGNLLPDTEVNVTNLAVYSVYQLKMKVALNSPAWMPLNAAAFNDQYRQCTNEVAFIRTNVFSSGFFSDLNFSSYWTGMFQAEAEIVALGSQYDANNPPPSITGEPGQMLMVTNGSRVTFSVQATCPNPISYQWYWGALNDFSNAIPFANSSTYTTPVLTTGQLFACFAKLSSRSRTPYVTAGSFSASVAVGGPPGGGPPGGAGVAEPFNTLSNWAAACSLPVDQRGGNDDPAGIKVPNAIAYALGINPYQFNPQQLPQFAMASNLANLHFTRPLSTIGYIYSIQSSSNLIHWNSETLNKISETGTYETWGVSLPGTNNLLFLRFGVSR